MSSVGYAARLSNYDNKGEVGAEEIPDEFDLIHKNVSTLVELLKQSKCTVVHTGAGISTVAGIPDFRGPKGVWTVEKYGGDTLPAVAWEKAKPTLAHMALVALLRAGIVDYIVSQNVDGLHLRSGIPRDKLSELHGNIFMEYCESCDHEYLRSVDVGGCGLKPTGRFCTQPIPVHQPVCSGGGESVMEEMTLGTTRDSSDGSRTVGESYRVVMNLTKRRKLSGNGEGDNTRGGIEDDAPKPHDTTQSNTEGSVTAVHSAIDNSRAAAGEASSNSIYRGAVITTLPVIAPHRPDAAPTTTTTTSSSSPSSGSKAPCTPATLSTSVSGHDTGVRGVCGGVLRDTVLDWDDGLPAVDLDRAEEYCERATLHLVLGSSLQMEPASKLPLKRQRKGRGRGGGSRGKLVIVNLQKTQMDSKATLCIRARLDDVLRSVVKQLDISIPVVPTTTSLYVQNR